jgi:hypothetical protein
VNKYATQLDADFLPSLSLSSKTLEWVDGNVERAFRFLLAQEDQLEQLRLVLPRVVAEARLQAKFDRLAKDDKEFWTNAIETDPAEEAEEAEEHDEPSFGPPFPFPFNPLINP